MKIPNIDAGTENTKTGDNNGISFFFNDSSDFFSGFGVRSSKYKKSFPIDIGSLLYKIV